MLGVWLLGGAIAFAGAMSYAELAALRPQAGGEYVYLREAFGPLAGFLTGWTSFVAGFTGAMAASAVFLIVTLDRFIPGVANGTPLLAIPIPFTSNAVTFSIHTLAASAVIIVAALIHIRGVAHGRMASNVLTTFKIVSLVVFIGFGLTAGAGTPANVMQSVGPVTTTGFLFALIPVMFTYSGWNAASYMAEEIRDPGRNVPRALLMGTVIVIAIYLLINILYLYVIPIGELATLGGKSVLDVVGDRLLGARAGDIMAIVAIVSLAAGINAWTFAGPRVYFAMARDNAFFKSAGRVHPTYKTPAASIIAQAAFAILLVLTGSLDSIANYVGFAITLFAGTAVAAVFVLRRREPNAPRPFKALGYPWTPAIFVLASLAIVVNAFYSDPKVTGLGMVVILAGIPFYYYFQSRK
jgi:APA family basic amino acid/polyamine antiporter